MSEIAIIKANWKAPENIIAFTTTRQDGVSAAPFASLNLGGRSGDKTDAVEMNRQRLIQSQHLPSRPIWLQQIHGNAAIEINAVDNSNLQADASYTQLPNTICTILTADCLPILLCDRSGNEVAAIHAGWRSLASGIIKNTIQHFRCKRREILAWFGPAISKAVYEVGHDMREVFVRQDKMAAQAFTPIDAKHWLADLTLLARQRLQILGIEEIYGGEFCTYQQQDLFFSYRRDGQTGRIASLIYRREN